MLRELFESNKNIVINSDIDGFLCGMVLQKYYGCRIVGFSDSRDKVWLIPEGTPFPDDKRFVEYPKRPRKQKREGSENGK